MVVNTKNTKSIDMIAVDRDLIFSSFLTSGCQRKAKRKFALYPN
jgi:hypothetical protein